MGHFHLQRRFGGLDPSRNEKGATKEWCKKEKERNRQVRLRLRLGRWKHINSLFDLIDLQRWDLQGRRQKEGTLMRIRSVLSLKPSPVCVTCLGVKDKNGGNVSHTTTFLSNHTLGVDLHA